MAWRAARAAAVTPYVADAAEEAGGGCRRDCAACSLAELVPVLAVADWGKPVVAKIVCYLAQSSAERVDAAAVFELASSAVDRSPVLLAAAAVGLDTVVVDSVRQLEGCRTEGSACKRSSAAALDLEHAAVLDWKRSAADDPDAGRLSKTASTYWVAMGIVLFGTAA